jgi:hypothetical protein
MISVHLKNQSIEKRPGHPPVPAHVTVTVKSLFEP